MHEVAVFKRMQMPTPWNAAKGNTKTLDSGVSMVNGRKENVMNKRPTSIGSILFCKHLVIGYCRKMLKSIEKTEDIKGTIASARGVGFLASPWKPVTCSR